MSWAKTDTTNYSNIANKLRIQKPNETFLPSEMDDAIDDINGDIVDAYAACQSKGATLPQSQISANLAGTIQNIPEKNTLDEYFANTLEVVNIPSATNLDIRFFYKHTNLSSVIMPNVTTIGNNAFQDCTNLLNVIMPNVTSMGNTTFLNCANLALTSLPSGITDIGNGTFQNCTNLALTEIPFGVTTIGTNAFSRCANLALTSLPNSIANIGASSFQYCTSIPFLDFSEFTNIPVLGANAFLNTQFPFYFRDQQQIDEWAAATNWSTYANRFQIKPSEVI